MFLPIARDPAGERWQTGAVVPAPGAVLPAARGLPDGHAASPRFAAVGRTGGLSAYQSARSHTGRLRRLAPYAKIRQQLRVSRTHGRNGLPTAGAVAAAEDLTAARKSPQSTDRGNARRASPNRASAPTPARPRDTRCGSNAANSAAAPLWIRAPAGHPGSPAPQCAPKPRNGVLYIFMPPTGHLEDYLELVTAIEATAAGLSQPIVMEGYEPPRDPRLNSFRVTPDPGVIEVNIHPSASWDELVKRTTHLYEQARLSRLTSEKFMLDGRHTGTGGGNHFVLGGATTTDSPFLRRPDLLRSLLAYWHNHPALSYLFSGLFIGPTSQAPRLDEARNDSLYELELAFKELPPPGPGSARRGWSIGCSAICLST